MPLNNKKEIIDIKMQEIHINVIWVEFLEKFNNKIEHFNQS